MEQKDFEYLVNEVTAFFGHASVEARVVHAMYNRAMQQPKENYKDCTRCKCPACGATRREAVATAKARQRTAYNRSKRTFVDLSQPTGDVENFIDDLDKGYLI